MAKVSHKHRKFKTIALLAVITTLAIVITSSTGNFSLNEPITTSVEKIYPSFTLRIEPNEGLSGYFTETNAVGPSLEDFLSGCRNIFSELVCSTIKDPRQGANTVINTISKAVPDTPIPKIPSTPWDVAVYVENGVVNSREDEKVYGYLLGPENNLPLGYIDPKRTANIEGRIYDDLDWGLPILIATVDTNNRVFQHFPQGSRVYVKATQKINGIPTWLFAEYTHTIKNYEKNKLPVRITVIILNKFLGNPLPPWGDMELELKIISPEGKVIREIHKEIKAQLPPENAQGWFRMAQRTDSPSFIGSMKPTVTWIRPTRIPPQENYGVKYVDAQWRPWDPREQPIIWNCFPDDRNIIFLTETPYHTFVVGRSLDKPCSVDNLEPNEISVDYKGLEITLNQPE